MDFRDFDGNPSLQNSLELACENYKAVPHYASKEVLCLFSSLTNADPGDVFSSIQRASENKVQCNVISMSAAIFVLQKLCEDTCGQFKLAKDKDHLEDLFKSFLVPTTSFKSNQPPSGAHKIKVGFPDRETKEFA